MKFFIVDAFTEQPFGGNTAGVVILPSREFPADDWMQQVAAELRYSETAFVRQDGPAAFTVRYFTPNGEVDLCGHATIATFGTLFQEGLVPAGVPCLNHTKAGDLEVIPGEKVMMQMAAPQRVSVIDDPEKLSALLHAMGGLHPGDLAPFPVEIISTGLPDIILPVCDDITLHRLQPRMDDLAHLSKRLNVVGVHAFAADFAPEEPIHVRNFAPRYAIPEESATGTANGALTGYLYLQGQLVPGDSCTFLQGEAMGRPSRIYTQIELREGQPDIRVGGPSVIVARGEI